MNNLAGFQISVSAGKNDCERNFPFFGVVVRSFCLALSFIRRRFACGRSAVGYSGVQLRADQMKEVCMSSDNFAPGALDHVVIDKETASSGNWRGCGRRAPVWGCDRRLISGLA
jgi:hypothetical protein